MHKVVIWRVEVNKRFKFASFSRFSKENGASEDAPFDLEINRFGLAA
tara:strand:- start:13575 stop:13715 length:141 start_codon:yes stop_codon:yes gene_type:complete